MSAWETPPKRRRRSGRQDLFRSHYGALNWMAGSVRILMKKKKEEEDSDTGGETREVMVPVATMIDELQKSQGDTTLGLAADTRALEECYTHVQTLFDNLSERVLIITEDLAGLRDLIEKDDEGDSDTPPVTTPLAGGDVEVWEHFRPFPNEDEFEEAMDEVPEETAGMVRRQPSPLQGIVLYFEFMLMKMGRNFANMVMRSRKA
mmetsp:Transcript_106744/g.331564  ORF Transcript_106744/g.331564 Transcript_106744/m.331564 type:complete len:205 (+) Transcript_106744:88-702(+)